MSSEIGSLGFMEVDKTLLIFSSSIGVLPYICKSTIWEIGVALQRVLQRWLQHATVKTHRRGETDAEFP